MVGKGGWLQQKANKISFACTPHLGMESAQEIPTLAGVKFCNHIFMIGLLWLTILIYSHTKQPLIFRVSLSCAFVIWCVVFLLVHLQHHIWVIHLQLLKLYDNDCYVCTWEPKNHAEDFPHMMRVAFSIQVQKNNLSMGLVHMNIQRDSPRQVPGIGDMQEGCKQATQWAWSVECYQPSQQRLSFLYFIQLHTNLEFVVSMCLPSDSFLRILSYCFFKVLNGGGHPINLPFRDPWNGGPFCNASYSFSQLLL